MAVGAHAESLSFVKVGKSYELTIGNAFSVTVIEDSGGGWYKCRAHNNGEVHWYNLNLVILIKELPEQPRMSFSPDGSQRKAPVGIAGKVKENLRILRSGASQYCLENSVSNVRADKLIGPGKYADDLQSIDGEDYSSLLIELGGRMSVTTRSGVTITEDP